MIKRLVCMLLATAALLTFAACNEDEGTPPGVVPDTDDLADMPAEIEEPFIITEDTLVFVQNNISEYVIIRPEAATESNIKAATELQSYIKKISGVEIPVKTDAEPVGEYEIAVGYTNRSTEGQFDAEKLGEDGFVIETVNKKLFIAGSGVRGALYGVYTFLEEYLGCRFYTSEYEKIPTRDILGIQPIARDEQIPIFEYRDLDFVTSRSNNFQPKLKINGVYNYSPAEYGGRVDYVGEFVHTMEKLVSEKEYFAEHPEYFALNEDGSRQTGWGAQHCLTNPDVLSLVKEKVRALLAENPNADIISISQPDNSAGMLPCMCENCRRVYEEEGAYSGTMIRFVNAVAAELADEYPNVKFDTLAYHHTRSVCKTAPLDNVIIRLCTIECCFAHPLGTCIDVYAKAYGNKSISEDIADWGAVCDNIYIWDYTTNYTEPISFFPNFNSLLPNAQFFANNNVIGVYEEGNFFSETCDFPELRAYIMAKILWNPYMSEEEYWGYIDEFLKDYYGAGWQYIREYIELGQSIVADKHIGIHDKFTQTIYAYGKENNRGQLPEELTLEMIRNYESTDWSKYLDYGRRIIESELVTRGRELFAAAREMATEEEALRIDKTSLLVDFLHSYALYEKYSVKDIKDSIYNLLYDFLYKSEAGKSVDSAEKSQLIISVRNHVVDKYAKAYGEYNRELFDNAMKFKINQLGEGLPKINSIDEVNLALRPQEWKKK